jgi:hypothetical protein
MKRQDITQDVGELYYMYNMSNTLAETTCRATHPLYANLLIQARLPDPL